MELGRHFKNGESVDKICYLDLSITIMENRKFRIRHFPSKYISNAIIRKESFRPLNTKLPL